jgi:hypothetical protein
MQPNDQKKPLDVTSRASSMPRDSALLYRNKSPKDSAASHYRGLLKLSDGRVYLVGLWVRQVKGEPALEIRLSEKQASHSERG